MRVVVNLVFVEDFFKKCASNNKQPLEISHGEALNRIESLLKCPMGVTLKLEMENVAKALNTLTVLRKLLHRLRGIVGGQEERDE